MVTNIVCGPLWGRTEVWHWFCQCCAWRIAVNGPFWQAVNIQQTGVLLS